MIVISDTLDESLDMGHCAMFSCPLSQLIFVPDSWDDVPIPFAANISQTEIQLILNFKTGSYHGGLSCDLLS